MYSPQIKRGVFWLEGLNSLATTFYFYFLFFFLEQRFGFGERKNLVWAAVLGFTFAVSSLAGGRFGQRAGYFTALTVGFAVMCVSLTLGGFLRGETGHLLVMIFTAFGMCLTWANLEALTAEGETPASLQNRLGVYNLVWSAGNGVAYFLGGAMMEHLGERSIFFVPAALHLAQLLLLWRMRSIPAETGSTHGSIPTTITTAPLSPPAERRRSPVPPATFMRMAWLANPFAYVAINTAVPLIPFLAGRLELTPTAAGVICSTWLFARTLAFGLLWKWNGWHYRYRFLSAAYVAMIVGFGWILVAGNVPQLIAAQVLFGLGLGLIYYSSLYYSMDVGEAKGDHGGLHEAAIGSGIFAGPVIALLAIRLFPGETHAAALGVCLLLLAGYAGLNWMRWRRENRR